MKKWAVIALLVSACGELPAVDAGVEVPDSGVEVVDAGIVVNPWADRVVTFMPGVGAGFGQDKLPEVVLGPPRGAGANSGGLDVVSLGREGFITLEFTDFVVVDGPGVDLLVFENPFSGFSETGVVAVSDDGVDWRAFPCDAGVGCAGVNPVFSNPDNGISGTDPNVAGGDAFDLADVGLQRARFVRVTDSGANRFYGMPGGGFDLDALAVVNGVEP
ncbi:MAG: cell surface protein [Archangium sp.]